MLKMHIILMSMLIMSNMDKSWEMVMITINIIMMVLMMMNPLLLKTTMILLNTMIVTSWKFKIKNMKPNTLIILTVHTLMNMLMMCFTTNNLLLFYIMF